jgi:uncharacterized sulfatase
MLVHLCPFRRRLIYLILSATAFVPLAAESATAQRPKRPNILWLIAEDMGPELACYGTTELTTPTIDRLASQGVR